MEKMERINDLISKGEYDEALKLCTSNDIGAVKEIIIGFINNGQIDKVISASKSFKFYMNKDIQYIIVKNLMKNGNYKEALEICKRDIHKLDDNIKFEQILIYMKQEEYEEVLKICNNPLFKRSEKIQYGKIMVLNILKKYDEALSICEQEEFKNSEIIQYQHIELLESQKRFDEALEICDNPKFKNIIEFILKEKQIKELLIKVSNLESKSFVITNIFPFVNGYILEANGLSTGVTKKKKEYEKKTRTIYAVYEDDIIELGTYYLRLLMNTDSVAAYFYNKSLDEAAQSLINEGDKVSEEDLKELKEMAKEIVPSYKDVLFKTKKRILNSLDNLKYLGSRPLSEQESLDKVMKLIKSYKDYTNTNVDKTK